MGLTVFAFKIYFSRFARLGKKTFAEMGHVLPGRATNELARPPFYQPVAIWQDQASIYRDGDTALPNTQLYIYVY